MPKIYLIDGNAYIHRAYHALPPLTTSKGEMVNAVYGFIRMLMKIVKSEKPEYIAVCFDHPSPTFRHREYGPYKANRKKIDDDLKNQIPIVRRAVEALNVPSIDKEGYEADDVIATLARGAEKDGADVVVVSGDKDVLQLVDDKIRVWNETKDIWYDASGVEKKYGLSPERLVDMFALMGDASDNVPGLKGVGEKTAVKLVGEYGSVENLIKKAAHLEGKLKNSIEENHSILAVSKRLVTLCDDVKLGTGWRDFKARVPEEGKVMAFLKEYEFTSLLSEVFRDGERTGPAGRTEKVGVKVIYDEKELAEYFISAKNAPMLSVDTETTGTDPHEAQLVGVSMCFKKGGAVYVPIGHKTAEKQIKPEDFVKYAKGILEDEKIKKCGHNIKYDMHILGRVGVKLSGIDFDTMIASYCLNPSRASQGLKSLALEYLGVRMTNIEELIGKGAKRVTMADVDVNRAAVYAAHDAEASLELAGILKEKLKEKELHRLFAQIEMPVVPILASMEREGIKVDVPNLEKLSKEFASETSKLEKEIFALAGQEFNVNSPKQLSAVLFEKLNLPVIKKTKTGFSTDEEVLKVLSAQHRLPALLMEYRELVKLKSTYIDALIELKDEKTHRIHTSFNQAVTATGRLSSSEPNLQNIPVRTEHGRKIRGCFVAKKNCVLLSADYSQIDLRALAHISGDEALIEAFKKGEDIHSATAREVFGISQAKVDDEKRRIAKTINFGIVYGMGAFSLSQQLGIPASTAKEYIDSYFKRYAGVKRWMDKIILDAKKNGYVMTLSGRIRYLPEINASNSQVRGFAERTALNTPIQGTSADIIKIAMIEVDRLLREEGYGTKMLLQVHDELLFEVPEQELKAVAPLIREKMENAMMLKVPVVVDLKSGSDWKRTNPL
ncbi:MAG: DNA polymerase I [Endomicrobiales bacterium]|nr:DNA polymerase I [Endomicrobiales bacterium]